MSQPTDPITARSIEALKRVLAEFAQWLEPPHEYIMRRIHQIFGEPAPQEGGDARHAELLAGELIRGKLNLSTVDSPDANEALRGLNRDEYRALLIAVIGEPNEPGEDNLSSA